MYKHYWKSQPYDFIDTNDTLWSMLGNDSELFVGREILLIMQKYPRTYLPCLLYTSPSPRDRG